METSSDDSYKEYELDELYARPLRRPNKDDHIEEAATSGGIHPATTVYERNTLGPEFQHRVALLHLALEEQKKIARQSLDQQREDQEDEDTNSTASTTPSSSETSEQAAAASALNSPSSDETGHQDNSAVGSGDIEEGGQAPTIKKKHKKKKHGHKKKKHHHEKKRRVSIKKSLDEEPLPQKPAKEKKVSGKWGKRKLTKMTAEVHKDLSITWHSQDAQELADGYNTDLEKGLTDEQARAVLSAQGANEVIVRDRLKWIKKFIKWFFGGFGIILWPAAILCIIAYQPLGGSDADPANLGLAVVLLIVALLGGIFNAWQDWKSTRVINTLAKTLPQSAMVIRGGQQKEVPLREIVVGDLVVLDTGTRVPADCRLVEVKGLKVDNSILTGESEPVTCTTEKTDDNYMETKNLAFMGTNLVEGSGLGIVVATGNRSVMGKLSTLTHRAGSATTPITKEINYFMGFIVTMALITASAILLAWGLWLKSSYPDFLSAAQIVVTVIGTMIAFLPDGLPLCITLTLTLIAQRMQSVNVMVKSLPTVETLGSIDVIASDKTGTLTQNKMSVMHYLLEGTEVYDFNSEKDLRKYQTSELFKMLVKICCLCNAAMFDESTHNLPVQQRAMIGNASDVALLQFTEEIINTTNLRNSHRKVAEIPFNSRHKWMLSAWEELDGVAAIREHHNQKKKKQKDGGQSSAEHTEDERVDSSDGDTDVDDNNMVCVMMKGAPEYLIHHCSTVMMEDGTEAVLDDKLLKSIAAQQETFSSKGERVLGMCCKQMRRGDVHDLEATAVEEGFPTEDMCFIGLITLIDPPKPDVYQAIEDCHTAGISVVMVTGDHPSTATAIARMTGLVKNEKAVHIASDEDMEEHMASAKTKHDRKQIAQQQALIVTGVDLAGFSKQTWKDITRHKEVVFARTTPEHKLKIVKEFQKRKHVVAVTGDGVNDSPALKQANVGVAMGSGSDVAKDAADLILMDSQFASMVKGIYYGRIVFENLRKVVLYLLPAGSFSELMPILANVFLGMPLPLSSFLMIVICAITDVLPSLSLIYEGAESRLMEKTPRSITKEKLVNVQLLFHAYFFIGMMESITAFGMYFYYMKEYGGIDIGSLFLCFDNYTDGFFGKTQHELDETLYTAQSIFFVTLVVLQVTGNLMATRTRRNSFFQQLPFKGPTKNPRLWVFGGLSIAMAVQVVYLPLFNDVFNTRPIPEQFWFIPIGVGLLIFAADELRKVVTRMLPFKVARWICW